MTGPFHDRATVYVAIESTELAPSDITARLGIRPDREWLIGDARGKTGKQWDVHGWVLETVVRSEDAEGRSASALIPIALERFEKRLRPAAKSIAALGSSIQPYTVLAVLAESVPGIELEHSLLRLLHDIGGTFQVDLSTYAPEE